MAIYANFEGGARFGQNFQKKRRKFGQIRVFRVVWESQENQFGDLKKGRQSFQNFPREIPRSAPDFSSYDNSVKLQLVILAI